MNFSIILNSRGRPAMLNNLLASILKNTTDPKGIEVLVNTDNDDIETMGCIGSLEQFYKRINLSIWSGKRPTSLHTTINSLAKMAKGQYIFVLNDDTEIQTPNWDSIAIQKISEFKNNNKIKDDIIYCFVSDNSVDRDVSKGYASFPIISKQATQVLGFFFYEEFVGLGGDSSMHRVYKEINRVVNINEILIDHIYHNTIFKVMAPDQTAAEMRAKTHANLVDPFTFDVSKEVNKLKEYIKRYD
jgi:hypothetical protein